jgi:hypothetical protein
MGELGRFKLKFAPDVYTFASLEQIKEANSRIEEASL